jgi:hypothetical protein
MSQSRRGARPVDADGVEFTDALYETVDEAKGQAEFEFNVRPDEWQSA